MPLYLFNKRGLAITWLSLNEIIVTESKSFTLFFKIMRDLR